MRSIELGLVLAMEEAWADGSTPRWVASRWITLRALRVLRWYGGQS